MLEWRRRWLCFMQSYFLFRYLITLSFCSRFFLSILCFLRCKILKCFFYFAKLNFYWNFSSRGHLLSSIYVDNQRPGCTSKDWKPSNAKSATRNSTLLLIGFPFKSGQCFVSSLWDLRFSRKLISRFTHGWQRGFLWEYIKRGLRNMNHFVLTVRNGNTDED